MSYFDENPKGLEKLKGKQTVPKQSTKTRGLTQKSVAVPRGKIANAERNFPDFKAARRKAAKIVVEEFETKMRVSRKSQVVRRRSHESLRLEIQYAYAQFIILCARADKKETVKKWAGEIELREKGDSQALSVTIAKFLDLSNGDQRQCRNRNVSAIRFLIFKGRGVKKAVETIGDFGGVRACAQKWRGLRKVSQ